MKTNNIIKQIRKLKEKLKKHNEKNNVIIKKCSNKIDFVDFETLRKAIINHENINNIIELVESSLDNISFYSDDETNKLKKIIHSNNDLIVYLSWNFYCCDGINENKIDDIIDKLIDLLQKLEREL